jgi:hypothetical protein
MAAASAVTLKPAVNSNLTVYGGTCTVDLASIDAGASEEVTIAVPDAKVGDSVIVSSRTVLTDGLVGPINPRVASAGSVSFWIENNHSGAIDQASGVFDFLIIRGAQGVSTLG